MLFVLLLSFLFFLFLESISMSVFTLGIYEAIFLVIYGYCTLTTCLYDYLFSFYNYIRFSVYPITWFNSKFEMWTAAIFIGFKITWPWLHFKGTYQNEYHKFKAHYLDYMTSHLFLFLFLINKQDSPNFICVTVL